MARKICPIILFVALLASARLGAGAPDWVSDFTNEMNTMNRNFQDQMQQLNRNIHEQVQQLTHNLQSQIQQTVQSAVQPALAEADKIIKNLPRDSQGHIISNGGSSIVRISSVNGITRTIMSGRTPDGEPYIRDIEERTNGQYLYHNETSYNPKTKASERIRWRLDLTTPGAKPEIFTDEN